MRSHFVKACPIWPGFPCRLCCPSTPGVANEQSPSGWATPRSNAVCGFPPLPRVSGASGRMRLGRLRLGRRARGSLSVETTHGGDPQLHRTTWSDRRLRQPGDDVGEVITQIVETLDYTHRRLADGEGSDETSQVSANRVEPEPPLALSVSSSQISEGGSSTITATNKNGDTFTVDQTVTFQLAGTAAEGADYTITPPSITITAGGTSGTATITALSDSTTEAAETIVIIGEHDGQLIGTATIAIRASSSGGGGGGGSDDGGGEELPPRASELFEDVAPGVWYESAISWMILHRVTQVALSPCFAPRTTSPANNSSRSYGGQPDDPLQPIWGRKPSPTSQKASTPTQPSAGRYPTESPWDAPQATSVTPAGGFAPHNMSPEDRCPPCCIGMWKPTTPEQLPPHRRGAPSLLRGQHRLADRLPRRFRMRTKPVLSKP